MREFRQSPVIQSSEIRGLLLQADPFLFLKSSAYSSLFKSDATLVNRLQAID